MYSRVKASRVESRVKGLEDVSTSSNLHASAVCLYISSELAECCTMHGNCHGEAYIGLFISTQVDMNRYIYIQRSMHVYLSEYLSLCIYLPHPVCLICLKYGKKLIFQFT